MVQTPYKRGTISERFFKVLEERANHQEIFYYCIRAEFNRDWDEVERLKALGRKLIESGRMKFPKREVHSVSGEA